MPSFDVELRLKKMRSRKPDPAALFAEAFIDRFGADAGRRLEFIAAEIGLRVVDVNADSFEGVLRRIKGRLVGTVGLSRSVRDARRRRFTLAHEIAHYLMPTHSSSSSPCRPADIERWDPALGQREIEANRFAAAALMPRAAFPDLLHAEPGLGTIEQIASRQETSLTASAYRYVELSSERVAIAWSEDGIVKWVKRSEEFYRWIRIGAVPAGSVAAQVTEYRAVAGEFERVDAAVWLDDRNLVDDATILEQSRRLGSYGVLTLLWIDQPVERWGRTDEIED
jgi:hypothetical protein